MRGGVTAFWLFAGACDTSTGAALVTAPATTFSLMGLHPPHGEAEVFVRFLGVFVGCVGAAYFWPFLSRAADSRATRLVCVLEVTALVRLAVAMFLAIAVASTALPQGWLAVGGFDAAVALLQLALRELGAFDHVV